MQKKIGSINNLINEIEMKQINALGDQERIILLGDSYAGKTITLRRLMNEPFTYQVTPTQMNSLRRVKISISGLDIMCLITDTDGHGKMANYTITTYCKNQDGALIYYDITDENSLISLKFLVAKVKQNSAPHIQIMVVGNKIDMENQRKIQTCDVLSFCQSEGIRFMEASAKENINVKQAFEQLVGDIVENRKSRHQRS